MDKKDENIINEIFKRFNSDKRKQKTLNWQEARLALVHEKDSVKPKFDATFKGSVDEVLVLASPDAQRFNSTMGTDFLARIAELASAALSRLR